MEKYTLTLKEASEFIGISIDITKRWIKTGRLTATRKNPTKKKSDYLITRQNCIAAINNPIHTVVESAEYMQEDKKCRYSAGEIRGTPTSRYNAAKELSNLLEHRTEGKRRSCTTS